MPLFLSIQVPKGGPGKTATTHALSYAFAFRCLNVLVVDCDSQRDLTSAFFGETIENNHDFEYSQFLAAQVQPCTLWQSLQPLLQPGNQQLNAPVPVQKMGEVTGSHGSLHVICGDQKTNNLGVKIGTAWSLSAVDSTKMELPGAPFKMIERAAQAVRADVVILDLHPDLSPLNCMLLMSSDYFISPVEADSPSLEAMWNLKDRIMSGEGGQAPEDRPWSQLYREWVIKTQNAVAGVGPWQGRPLDLRGHQVRDVYAKFMGVVMNKFPLSQAGDFLQGVVTDVPSDAVCRWMSQQLLDAYRIAKEYQDPGNLGAPAPGAPLLQSLSRTFAVPQQHYDTRADGTAYNDYLMRVIARVPHFGVLNSVSQENFVPVSHIASNDVSPADRTRVARFRRIYDQLAYNILLLAYRDNPATVNHQLPANRLGENPPMGGPPGHPRERFIAVNRNLLMHDPQPPAGSGNTADHWPL